MPRAYGEPQYPVLLSVSVSDEMNRRLRAMAAADEVSLSEIQRTLMREAIEMRDDEDRAQREFAATPEGAPCVAMPLPAETQEGRPRPASHTVTRVGGQLVHPAVPVRKSRAQLMAEARGEQGAAG